jgi:RimJ/RimL family protein N-acetyltransferase
MGSVEPTLLGVADLDDYVQHVVRHMAESGTGNGLHFVPYPPSGRPDAGAVRARRAEAWATPVGQPGWERCLAIRTGGRIIGHSELKAGRIMSEMHRATLGMGLEAPYRSEGLGTRLLSGTLELAKAHRLSWIDLFVFSENRIAQELYARFGFRRIGVTVDRFRIDGKSIDDVAMALDLRAPSR